MGKFLGEQKDKRTRGALYPFEDIDIAKDYSIYKEKLDDALSDPRINNVAVTAPYDSGKTSILMSYFKQRRSNYKWYIRRVNQIISIINTIKRFLFFSAKSLKQVLDYEFISIPDFFGNSADIKESELEKKIIEQLLLKTNPQNYPDSRIHRIVNHGRLRNMLGFLRLIGFLGLMIYFSVILGNFNFSDGRLFRSINFMWLILLLSLGIFYMWHIYIKAIHSMSKIIFSAKGTAGPFELAITGNTNNGETIDLFNTYADELLYYFKKSRTRIVIFEDLDRFKKPIIFQKLRELNNNLNKQGTRIVFIYVLKDAVFEKQLMPEDNTKGQSGTNEVESLEIHKGNELGPAELRGKFFDYIISIFPLHSYYNSKKTFNQEIQKYSRLKEEKIKDKYISGLGNFIHDNRAITAIISEMDTYVSIFNKNSQEINYNKLLGILSYKNLYPGDFDKISTGKSKLEYLFNHRDDFDRVIINDVLKEKNAKVEKLTDFINYLKNQVIKDVETLMEIRFYQFSINKRQVNTTSGNYNDDDNSITAFFKEVLQNKDLKVYISGKWVLGNTLFSNNSEKKLIQDYLSGTVSREAITDYNAQLITLNQETRETTQTIRNQKFSEMFSWFITNNKEILLSDEQKKNFEFVENNLALRYLVINSLIDSTFYEYISPTAFDEISWNDNDFVKHVLSCSDLENTLLDKPIKTILALTDANANYYYAFSSNLLAELLKNSINDDKSKLILQRAKEKGDATFFENFYSGTSTRVEEKITYLILKFWPKFWGWYANKMSGDKSVYLQARTLLSILSKEQNKNLFESLEDENLFENKIYKKALVEYLITENNFTILSNYRHEFSDIKFIVKNQKIVTRIFKNQWYIKNYTNFEEALFSLGLTDLKSISQKQSELNLDLSYLYDNIQRFYSERVKNHNLSYSEFIYYINFLLEGRLGDKVDSNLSNNIQLEPRQRDALDLYQDTSFSPVLKEEEKENILKIIGLASLLKNKKIDQESINNLLVNNKLIYNHDVCTALYQERDHFDFISYIVNFENEDIVKKEYKEKKFSVIFEWLLETKYPEKIVKMLEKDNLRLDQFKGKDNSQLLLILSEYISSYEKISLVLQVKTSFDIKIKIIDAIMRKFPQKMSIQALSNYLFEKDFMSGWKIDGHSKNLIPEINQDKQNKFFELLKKWSLLAKRSSVSSGYYIVRKDFFKYFNRS